MTFQKYTELRENLIDEFARAWPDTDIVIPGYAEVQRNEGILLESEEEKQEKKVKGELKMTKTDLEKAVTEAFHENYEQPEIEEAGFGNVYSRDSRTGKWSQTEHSKLDEREYHRSVERQKKGKAQSTPLTEAQQVLFNEATGVKKEVDHSLDEAFAEVFGSSGHKAEILDDVQEAELGNLLFEDLNLADINIEESPRGPFKFRGKALKVNRRNKNNRRYRRDITEKALKESQSQTMTIRDGHPTGPQDTAVSPIIGKVVFEDIDSEGWMPFSGQISNTSRGMDIQQLLRDKVIGNVSLRSKGKTAIAKMDGETVEDVIDLHFRGLDMIPEGSEEGAGVDEILNSVS